MAVATRPEFIEVLVAVATRPEFIEVLGAVATRPDVTLERVETDHVMYAATRTLEIGAGTIEAGTVARTHGQWHGVVDGERFRTMSIERTMEPVVTGVSGAPLRQIEITGDPYVSLAVELRRRPDDPRRTTAERYGVAGAVLNAHVLAAAPGVCLPPMAAPWRRSLVG